MHAWHAMPHSFYTPVQPPGQSQVGHSSHPFCIKPLITCARSSSCNSLHISKPNSGSHTPVRAAILVLPVSESKEAKTEESTQAQHGDHQAALEV